MKKAAIPTLVLIVIIAIIVLLWLGGSIRDDETTTAVSPGFSDPATRASEGVAPIPAANETTRAPLEVADPNQSDEHGFEAPPVDGMPIRVVHGSTDQPLPGAVVSLVDFTEAAPGSSQIQRPLAAFDEMVEREGRRYRADEEGWVSVPQPQGEQCSWVVPKVSGEPPPFLRAR